MKSKFLNTIFVVLISSISSIAHAGLISGNLNVDNDFFAYISTSNDEAGTLVSQGNDWTKTNSFDFALVDGVNYFLHVNALDRGVIAGFLGDFTLTGTDHFFANGLQTVLTNGVDWQVSTTGWENYTVATAYAQNGTAIWGNRAGGHANAQWIWSDTNVQGGAIDREVFFTIAINSATAVSAAQVPEPSTLAILALGILGFAARRTKK